MQTSLTDIDELLLKCRDMEAQKYIREAINSYKVGAFRACIVMTWIAVLYDFLYKLRELELAGDKQAEAKLGEFEDARDNNDYKKSWAFEESILEASYKDFEFINKIEYEELNRLRVDRNHCAHPAMNSKDEIYEPSSEQARYHLRNAVTYMLERYATQGKSFVDGLIRETTFSSFPNTPEQAIKLYKSKHLERAKDVVIRNLATAFVKGMFQDDFGDTQILRTSSALNALRDIKRPIVEDTIAKQLVQQVSKLALTGSSCMFALRFLIQIPDTFQYLEEQNIIFIENSIKNERDSGISKNLLVYALDISELQDFTIERIQRGRRIEVLASYFRRNVAYRFKNLALELYETAESFSEANELGSSIILPLVANDFFSIDDIERVFTAHEENSQVSESHAFSTVIRAISLNYAMPDRILDSLHIDYPNIYSRYSNLFLPDTNEADEEDFIPF